MPFVAEIGAGPARAAGSEQKRPAAPRTPESMAWKGRQCVRSTERCIVAGPRSRRTAQWVAADGAVNLGRLHTPPRRQTNDQASTLPGADGRSMRTRRLGLFPGGCYRVDHSALPMSVGKPMVCSGKIIGLSGLLGQETRGNLDPNGQLHSRLRPYRRNRARETFRSAWAAGKSARRSAARIHERQAGPDAFPDAFADNGPNLCRACERPDTA